MQQAEILENLDDDQEPRVIQPFMNYWSGVFSKFRAKTQRENWPENIQDISIIILIICMGMFIRVVLAYTFRENYTYDPLEEIIWNRKVLFNIEGVEFRGFVDFNYYYVAWVKGWYQEAWYPYQWHDDATVMDFYSYPPVFLYFLVITWRPGMNYFWLAFPMILSDAACAGIVYLIIKNILPKKNSRSIAIIGGFLMAIAPINVIYDGVYWLNPGPVTLFTIVAFYFAIKKKWWQAFFWLAVATMTKQNALFFTLPLFMAMLGEKVRNKSIKEAVIESIANALLYVGVGLILSVPWVFISPYQYLRHMMFPGRPMELRFTVIDPSDNDCVSLAKSMEQLGFPQWILAITSLFNYSMLGMIVFSCIIGVFMMWRTYKGKMDKIEFFEWIAIYTILTHILMPRGVYKFYTAYFTPMILIAFLCSFVSLISKKEFLPIGIIIGSTLFLGFNFWLLTIPRFPVPFYLLMVSLVIALIMWFRAYFRDRQLISTFNSFNKFLDTKIGA